MALTLVNNIGIHRILDLAHFKIAIKGVDKYETMNSDEKWNSLFLTQINNGDIKMVRNVLIL